jgi:hypothetical protein
VPVVVAAPVAAEESVPGVPAVVVPAVVVVAVCSKG